MKRLSLIVGVAFLLVLAAALSASASQTGAQVAQSVVLAPVVGGRPHRSADMPPSWAIVTAPTVTERGTILESVKTPFLPAMYGR